MTSALVIDLAGRTANVVSQHHASQLTSLLAALGLPEVRQDGTLVTTPVSSERGDASGRNALVVALNSCRKNSCLLVDLSQNAGHLCDEPFLIALADLLDDQRDRFNEVVLVLPFKMFSSKAPHEDASVVRFQNTACKHLIVVDSQLTVRDFQPRRPRRRIRKLDVAALVPHIGTAEDRLRALLVPRLGHFRAGGAFCRSVSYVVRHADSVLDELLHKHFDDIEVGTLIFDARRNDWLRNAVIGYCAGRRLPLVAIDDITDHIKAGYPPQSPLVLLADVICTGATVQHHLETLRPLGHPLSVYSVLGQSRTIEVHGTAYVMKPFVELSVPVAERQKCQQCGYGLPHQRESELSAATSLREFDFWTLLMSVEWQQEPDHPEDAGKPYPRVPNYEHLLKKAGDSVAYLMANRLRQIGGRWALVHPAQRESSALIRRLKMELEDRDVAVIPIPDDIIIRARKGTPGWQDDVDNSTDLWRTNLDKIRQLGWGAVVIDIFSGSGKTLRALKAILEQATVPVQLLYPFVERNPIETAEISTLHTSLYTWWGPRKDIQ